MIRAALLVALLAASPAAAEPNAQLLRSIEARLSQWSVGPVDYAALTTSQASALHLKLTNAPSRFSGRSAFFRQELLTILKWDGSERTHSINKSSN